MKQNANNQIVFGYAREDLQPVKEIYNRLEVIGYNCWLDETNLIPGQNFREDIDRAIKNSNLLIVCFSQAFISCEEYWYQLLRSAMSVQAKMPPGVPFLLPLRLEECEIPTLEVHGIDLTNIWKVDIWKPYSFDKLLRAIRFAI
jgi:hypothetical protein